MSAVEKYVIKSLENNWITTVENYVIKSLENNWITTAWGICYTML